MGLTLSGLNLSLSSLSTKVDEEDLKWLKNLRKLSYIVKSVSWKFSFKILGCRKIKSVFRDVK